MDEKKRSRLYIPGKWLLIGAVLVAAHTSSALYAYLRQPSAGFHDTFMQLDLPKLGYHSSFDDWEQATPGSDSANYLHVARNFADGHGVTSLNRDASPPKYEPFVFWGPGTPVVFGLWLKLTGGQTAMSLFVFAVLSQLIFGGIVVATAALFTRNTFALCLTALLTGCCPPLLNFFYGVFVSNSEIVNLIPLASMYFALAKGFLAYRDPAARWWTYAAWFAAAGVAIGAGSLVRDSLATFSVFLALYFLAGAVRSWSKPGFRRAAIAAACVVGATQVTRLPVEFWNKSRVYKFFVSSSTKVAIWQSSLWSKYDAANWYDSAGIGFGEVLDPEEAKRVNEYFAKGAKLPQVYSAWELALAIGSHPLEALEFKAARLPVIWLGTDRWPRFQWTLISVWCVGAYALLGIYLAARWWSGKRIPEILYLYAIFLCCALPLIHYEFRYSLPVWNVLLLVPGLLVEHLWTRLPGRIFQGRIRATRAEAVGKPQPAAVKHEAVKHEAAKHETVKHETVKHETVKHEVAKHEALV